jgi:hypothetical protein
MSARAGLLALITAVTLAMAACGDDEEEAKAPAPPPVEDSSQPSTESSDPLVGEWDSGPVPISKIRSSIVAAGYADADVDKVLRYVDWTDAKRLRFNLKFYREGDRPFVVKTGWDPAAGPMPQDGDHGPYELLPKHRIAITSADPDIHKGREVSSYRVEGDRLTLRVLRLTDPGVTASQRRLDKLVLFASTAAPLRRVAAK